MKVNDIGLPYSGIHCCETFIFALLHVLLSVTVVIKQASVLNTSTNPLVIYIFRLYHCDLCLNYDKKGNGRHFVSCNHKIWKAFLLCMKFEGFSCQSCNLVREIRCFKNIDTRFRSSVETQAVLNGKGKLTWMDLRRIFNYFFTQCAIKNCHQGALFTQI